MHFRSMACAFTTVEAATHCLGEEGHCGYRVHYTPLVLLAVRIAAKSTECKSTRVGDGVF